VGREDFQGVVRHRLAVYATVVVAVIMFGRFGEAQFTALFAIAWGLHYPLIVAMMSESDECGRHLGVPEDAEGRIGRDDHRGALIGAIAREPERRADRPSSPRTVKSLRVR
jgi:hypothetical protein